MGSILDLVGSAIIAGLLLLMLLSVNNNVSEFTILNGFSTTTQENLTELATEVEYDFRKIGFRVANPNTAIISARIMDLLPRKVRRVNPSTMREKYSGGPNFRAQRARGGPTIMSPMIPIVPPMKDPKADIPRAGPALPFRAMTYPSRQVTTDAASPGMFRRMEVVDPPYMAP